MRAAVFILLVLFAPTGALACDGCGCRGGPGYRGQDGHCVGWAKLNKICGNPPTRCAYEGAGLVGALPALSSPGMREGAMVPAQKAPVPVTSNVLQAKNEGLGCVDEATIQSLSNCEAAQPAKDCEQKRAELVKSQACFTIPNGTTGAIEAGSHSFDWLRVRVPGTIQPLWTPRSLFLDN